MPTEPHYPIEEQRDGIQPPWERDKGRADNDNESLDIIRDVFAYIAGLGAMVSFAIIGYALLALYFQGCPSP